LVTLASDSMLVILDLGVLLFAIPATDLPTQIGGKTGELFKLPEAGKGVDPAAQLQAQFQVIHRMHEAIQPLPPPCRFAPGMVRERSHFHRALPKISTERVFVEAREPTDRLLDIDEQTFRKHHDRREGEGHVRL
jgi:hypothetical protein